ncbi:MAG TPA: hypothetical protein VJJ23_01780 [Candidatus Nanoarchaeia archaeon]|nr:hypothetical protein [Candidatus Woesearchaeota archaeon]HLC55941.1 hypothetical protein [Candidatus Nanoarchaeia archaeon]
MNNIKKTEWILRIAMFGTFLGHGIFAIQLKPRFIEMLTAFIGVTGLLANKLMILIGIIDVTVAIFAILAPIRIVLIYGTIWGFLTALARPIAGDPIWDFVERWTNWGAPLALLYIKGLPKNFKDLFK